MIVTNITGIGDPQIVLHEGVYYCYATSLVEKGIRVWTSTDLENWQGPTLCFDASDNWGDCDYWAPEVVYHGGKFVMHYSARVLQPRRTLYLGVATADSPLGPFKDVWGKPMFDLGYATIDGSVLLDESGNYFYYSRDCIQNKIGDVKVSQVYCVQLDDTLTRAVGEHVLMTTPTEDWEMKSRPMGIIWNEGPNVIRWNGKYIMNYSTNYYASNDYAICIATADAPMGPWHKAPQANPVLSQHSDLFGAGHNAFFTARDGQLMTAFHVQTNPEHPSGDRRVCIGEVRLTERDGVIYEEII